MFEPARLSRGLSLSWNLTWLISPSHCTRRRSASSDTTVSLSMVTTYPRRGRRAKHGKGGQGRRRGARVQRLLISECSGERELTQGLSAARKVAAPGPSEFLYTEERRPTRLRTVRNWRRIIRRFHRLL